MDGTEKNRKYFLNLSHFFKIIKKVAIDTNLIFCYAKKSVKKVHPKLNQGKCYGKLSSS